ncbi:sensor histidine kinase [Cribrihabitans neustonicus]|uniref:sensor histidine kinase n=1 Tax=Cribrihabitans neustonicus TaxID=1429085 RepID=UPI003B58E58E
MLDRHYLEDELSQLIQTDPSVWQFIQEGSLDGIWYWDLENPDQEWMSPEIWRLFGVDPASKRHDPSEWQDLINPDDLKRALENFDAHCADPNHPYDQIVRYTHADGSTVWVRCRGIAIRDESGKPVRMLGAHNDLTAVKRAEQTEKAGAVLATEELRAFSYALSHDLKAPANTVLMVLNELSEHLEGQLDGEGREMLAIGLKTVMRMRSQIDALLNFTHVTENRQRHEDLDLAALTQEVLSDLRGDIAGAKAGIEVGELPVYSGNAVQIQMLIQNLLSNAIKFRRPGQPPRMRISAAPLDGAGGVRLSVADNGIGIAPADREKIFGMFQRLHVYQDYPGSGLGLSMCRRVARNHGGSITVADTPGGGTTFIVNLPGKHS